MDALVSNAFNLFFANSKKRAISGMWIAKVTKGGEISEEYITSIRKIVFKIFNGTEKTFDTGGATVSIAPDIKISNKISVDVVETNKGKVKNDIYVYLREVLPTIDNNRSGDGYYKFDILSNYFNAWVNFYDRFEVFYFLDPVARYSGPYWKMDFTGLKLDGSSGVLSSEEDLNYENFGLINNDLNLYYDSMTMDFVDGSNTTKLFKIDFNEHISELNSF